MNFCEDNDINDIEDIIAIDDITPKQRYNNPYKKDAVTVRSKKRTLKKNHPAAEDSSSCVPEKKIYKSIIPGIQKIYLKTWGCSHNNSDSEYMAGALAHYGYQLTADKLEADLWVLNSCTVKNPAEQAFVNEIKYGETTGKHVVLAGCVPQGNRHADFMKGHSIIGVMNIDRIVEVVEETLKGNTVKLLNSKCKDENGRLRPGPKLSLPKIRKNPYIEIIPINSGCLNQCTYCKTKHSRGDLISYTLDEIVERAKQAIREGCCEIWLTSEDLGTWGRDFDQRLPDLLRNLLEVIPENCMIRLGMTNPPYILEYLEQIAEILKHPRMYAFLHVPVQSGSDTVLGDMKREYCRKDFEHVVEYLRQNVPGVTIATDIICGFPTETQSDFEETVTLCAKYKFPSLFINQFFPRPGTPAANMKRIPGHEVKERTKKLTEVFYGYEPYKDNVGRIYDNVLVTEISHDKRHYVGHNKSYEQILLSMSMADDKILGKCVRVRITAASKFSMSGEILDSESEWRKCSTIKNGINVATNGKLVFEETNGGDLVRKEENLKTMAVGYALIALFLALVYRFIWKML